MIYLSCTRRLLLAAGLMLTCLTAAADDASVTLNLKDADINALITTVSEVTGKNFIVDPRVKGKVTVISSSPMDPAAVYQTFLSVLQVEGFAAIPSGSVIKVIPETNARQEATPLSTGAGIPRDDVVTRVFALHNASAAQMVPILRPLVPQWGQLAAYAPGNMLIVADRAANVRRLAGIIGELDSSSDEGVEILALQHANATDVVRMLTTLAQQDKKSDPTAHEPAVIADERTNSVIIAGDKSARMQLLDIVHKLDSPFKGDQGDTQVVYLRYADAENLAPILQGYAQSSTSTTGNRTPAQANRPAGGTSANGDVTVLSDKDTNALIITAPPKTMQMLHRVIDQLDIRRAQVLVEAIIAEVSANKSNELGVDWAVFNRHAVAAAGILDPNTLSAISNLGTVATTTGTSTTSTLATAAAGLITQGATAAAGSFGGATTFALLLHALKSDGDTNILSTPNITTLDNEEAKIEVGQEVPFLTGSYANSGVSNSNGAVNPFQTIDRKDVGLSLGITPTINEGGAIRLKIKLENSSLSSGTAGSSNLITNKRTITDTVSVDSGQILVIGGLIGDQINQTKNGIPFLSDIPLIGSLFTYHNDTRTKQNLMVFIHPVILRQPGDVDYYTRQKYDEMRRAQIDASVGHSSLIGGDRPLLYKWDDYRKTSNKPGTVIPSTDRGLPAPPTSSRMPSSPGPTDAAMPAAASSTAAPASTPPDAR